MVLAIVGWMFIFLNGEHDSGLALNRRAVEINPNSLIALNFAGLAEHFAGDLDQAIAYHTRALELSPGALDNFWSLTGGAMSHLFARRYEEAIAWATRSLETYNEWDMTYVALIAAHGHLGQLEEAREYHKRWSALRRGHAPRGSPKGSRFPERDEIWQGGFQKAGIKDW